MWIMCKCEIGEFEVRINSIYPPDANFDTVQVCEETKDCYDHETQEFADVVWEAVQNDDGDY